MIPGKITTENIGQLLSRYSTAELEEMIVKFPYFREAHILLAKKYQQENNPKFDQQLQVAALYTNDRQLLFNLFNEKPNRQKPSFTFESISTESENKSEEIFVPMAEHSAETVIDTPADLVEQKQVDELPVEVKEEPVIEASGAVDIEEEIAVDEPIVLEEQEIPLHEQESIIENNSVDTIVEESVVEEIPLVQQELTEPIAEPELAEPENEVVIEESAGFEEEEEMVLLEHKVDNEPLLEEEIESAVTPQDDFEDIEETEEETVVTESEAEGEEDTISFSRFEEHTFDDWLKYFNTPGKKQEEAPAPTDEEQAAADAELDKLISTSVPLNILHEAVEGETRYSKGLDKFIEEQISLKKAKTVKKPQPRPGDEADLDPALVTETLARLYEAQRKYGRAIRAYEILTLKFPEKSDFFAARINYLKSLLI